MKSARAALGADTHTHSHTHKLTLTANLEQMPVKMSMDIKGRDGRKEGNNVGNTLTHAVLIRHGCYSNSLHL